MARAVKPGGQLLIRVDGREGKRRLAALRVPLRRARFTHLAIALVHRLRLYPAAVLWLALRVRLQLGELSNYPRASTSPI